ncbi:MAG: alanine--glyoxylate aminotransferase family protein [Candidatus Auribacter fodinae]|uniref:Alanine--glyoxylate aminotransferase family protein n=1 Tax=Candidatus Auribacter fodinae TaxID=2093366 RepID=A0A3A4RA07_9BACT|nr:MAG: alanine--glyoxylate aminotransferase family protein [Candidatus Auribacter fodinae]
MKKEYLMAPGPSPVPPAALLDMAQPIFHHRTPRFKTLFGQVNEMLKVAFRTANPVITFTSSGTGALEASMVNTMSPGDKAIVINGGKFGERFLDICNAYCINVVEIPVEWGTAVDPAVVEAKLKEHPDAKVVCSTLCETSTGVLTDIKALGAIVAKTDAILICDAISGLAADDIRTDEWQVDMVAGGSQKALMIPPGLGFLSVSEKAKKLIDNAKCQKFYFNLKKALKSYAESDTPWTPALTLIVGLHRTLNMIIEEGMDNVIARHAKLANATRTGIKAIGLDLYAPTCPSNAVTAVKVPEKIDGLAFVKKIRDEKGITIAGGQSQAKGKIFRLAHMGYAVDYDVLTALAATEKVLYDLGFSFEIGESVKAAQKALL